MKKKLLFMAILCIYSLGYSQGDTCATATSVTCGTDEFDYISYTTTGFTDTAGNSSNDVFFTITPASVETINVDTCFTDSSRDTKIVVYSDCSLTTIVAQNDDPDLACGDQARLSFIADGVSTYIIMVEGGDSPDPASLLLNGDFEMVVYCTPATLPPPVPDGCASPTSGQEPIVSDGLDNDANWDGDIATSGGGGSNSGMWEIIDTDPLGDNNPVDDPTTGGSNTGATGPSQQHSGATFMNYEASGSPNTRASAVFQLPIDLTDATYEAAELAFYMHAYGVEMGTLEVGVGTSLAGPFTTEFTWAGDYQQSADVSNDPWYQVGVDLSSYLGQTIYIEFAHTGLGTGFRGDMSIDTFEVYACDTVLDVENEENELNGLTLYPNPVRDFLNMRALEHIEEVSIYNLLGQKIKFEKPNSLQKSIDMTDLNSGVYIVKVKIGDSYGSYKVIKE